uniref:YqaA family protein n=1 Tax=Cellvibrio fontiphilus TaxID=1815559 RepID=UPI002B4C24B5|nr:YqaA family protein [Cellvibrio fontiphilus]
MVSAAMVYASLFITALIAATFFPLSSEALLVTLLQQGYSPFWLWLAATTGNTLGSCVNWYLGGQCLRFQQRKWFPVSSPQLARAQQQFQRYGIYSLLFAWLPVVGDPLTLLAGVMRVRFLYFIVLVALGKALRYTLVIWLSLQWF